MKRIIVIALFFINSNFSIGQNFYLKIDSPNKIETNKIDSIGYKTKHDNIKSIIEEYNLFSKKITKLGYLDFQSLDKNKINDSTFFFNCRLNKKIDYIYIKVENLSVFELINEKITDTFKIPFNESELFIQNISKKLESAGYSMTKTQLKSLVKKNNILYSRLNLDIGNKRNINNIIVNGYEKFPLNHKKNLIRLFKNKTFNAKNLENLYFNINKFRFINQTKYPEVLFKKDSTIAYIYLEKSKSNTFDGIIGFSNDEQNNVVFNGYLDLKLNNILNSGEHFSLFWKSDGQEQTVFNILFELPYLFSSPIGLKTELQIFKQDSTFQNTKTSLNLGYFFNYNTRLYLGYDTVESSDIQNTNTTSISDYKNKFYTSTFEYNYFDRSDLLFQEKTSINLKFGTGERISINEGTKQFISLLKAKHNFNFNERNSLNLKLETFYLDSKKYIINELHRFGGINSIRGFNENSLQANTLYSIQTEYRYRVSSNLYIHNILDYGYFEDKISNFKNNVNGIGFGIGLITKNGLLNIIYANGSSKDQNITLSNSIIHISLKASF